MSIDQRTEAQKKADAAYCRYVREGIKLLEEEYGDEWANLGQEVWSDLFDITDPRHCVLGGIGEGLNEGDYGDLVVSLGLTDGDEDEDAATEAWRFGFTAPPKGIRVALTGLGNETAAWGALQRLWVDALESRGVEVRNLYE